MLRSAGVTYACNLLGLSLLLSLLRRLSVGSLEESAEGRQRSCTAMSLLSQVSTRLHWLCC